MPSYVYGDGDGHRLTVVHPMIANPVTFCPICGLKMWRVPQVTAINWNGNRAVSNGDVVRQMIKDAPRKRDEYAATKAEHVKKTAEEKKRLATDPTYGKVHHEHS